MSIFETLGNLFGTETVKTEKKGEMWQGISTEQELDDIISVSNQRPQIIYKHSTRCATSYFALKNMESISPLQKEQADFYIIDVIAQRPMSVYIAQKFEIRHESPQVLVIKNGEAVWHGSHHQVQADIVIAAL